MQYYYNLKGGLYRIKCIKKSLLLLTRAEYLYKKKINVYKRRGRSVGECPPFFIFYIALYWYNPCYDKHKVDNGSSNKK